MCSLLTDIAGMQGGPTSQTVTAAPCLSTTCAPMCPALKTAASILMWRARPGYRPGNGNCSGLMIKRMTEPNKHTDDTAELLPRLSGEEFCYLTTTGRLSGRPHEIEIWFAIREGSLYLLSGGGEGSDWVKNLIKHPSVTCGLRITFFQGQRESSATRRKMHWLDPW